MNLQLADTAPWKQRFRAAAILWTRVARSAPDRGLAVTNPSGVYQLYAWDLPSGTLTQLTSQAEGKMLGLLAPDGQHVYYLDDQSGNEIGHYCRVPFEGGPKQDISPDLPLYSPTGLTISGSGNRIGLATGSAEGFCLYAIDPQGGESLSAPRALHTSSALFNAPLLSHDGRLAVVASTERSGKLQFSLLAFDTERGELVAELWDGPDTSVTPVCFAPQPGDKRLLATTNRTGTETLLVWDPVCGQRTDLVFEGLESTLEGHDWSPDGARILLSTFDRAVQRVYVYDLGSCELVELDLPPGSAFMPPYFAPSGEVHVHWQTATQPSQLLAFDGQTGLQERVVLAAGQVPAGRSWRSISFPSSDGQEIQGWLAVPEGEGPFPTILDTHGGPTGVEGQGFNPVAQSWLDHGFAFLTINYRGSTTFGREFQEKILGDLGHWEVEDMVAARRWLVEEGIALEDRILLTGWSYGGYLTLQALGKYPDLWAGGMAGTAITDWVVQYEDSAEALRGYQVSLFGGMPEEKAEAYAAASPINYVEDLQAPVIIIQGRHDTRTPARPIEMYKAKMRALGKPIEVHWFESGHLGPYAQAEEAIEHQELFLRFAQGVVG
jgi:dipeptidyl aminopeptidase/acylaminoacyl peptidase